eukprot:CAMPEP_0175060880 /NCGR_PEP_ID=MMETSP0052_2-20121109/13275_1 /TAXON_ID=51329 ORGANISM="Polytomella parva, Strain SAG 63-3" /NCGR_SAMPLE_ID=MMETSP0052_2 /ASSEMBLY_ACC=CAM_ASM_000194 /LENGTH=182 /DNA_ID=CAMNT_0016326673 /DNA_START=392 /DNA_END=940 /DNA_ORIENTATION=-
MVTDDLNILSALYPTTQGDTGVIFTALTAVDKKIREARSAFRNNIKRGAELFITFNVLGEIFEKNKRPSLAFADNAAPKSDTDDISGKFMGMRARNFRKRATTTDPKRRTDGTLTRITGALLRTGLTTTTAHFMSTLGLVGALLPFGTQVADDRMENVKPNLVVIDFTIELNGRNLLTFWVV